MKKWAWIFFIFTTSVSEARLYKEWSLHLESKIESTLYPEEFGSNTNKNLNRLELVPIFDLKFNDQWKLFLKPLFVANPDNNSSEERTFFDPAETYIRYKGEFATVQAGNSVYAWGVTDGYNPLDVVNAKQYFDPLHSKKLGAPSVSLTQSWDNWDTQAIYIPWNPGATLPGTESRWLPREIFVPETLNNDQVLLLPPSLRYKYGTHSDLNEARRNNYALRISRLGEHFDFNFTGYEGVASFPLIQPQVTGSVISVSPKTVVQVDPDVVLNTKNYKIRQGGFSLVNHSWDILFKYATGYTQSVGDDKNLPGWTHENVLAVEKTFNLGSSGILIAVLQHSFIFSGKENESNLSVTEIFRKAWMLGGKLSWHEVWNFSFLGLYDQQRYSTYQEYSLGRRFFDTWSLTASANFIAGTSETPLGVYSKNDSYSLALSRSF